MLRYTSYLILFILLNALSLNIFARQIQLESTIYILDIAWSPSGTQLAVVGGDPGIIENSINISAHGYVSVVNSVTNQTIFMTEPTSVFTSVTWSPDGKLLA
jgi:WD40 repeat protein